MPVSVSGVILGTAEPSGPLPFGLPARKRLLSSACVMPRGVWHSPQWPTARTRYSPRARPDEGAVGGGVSRGAKAVSHAGRKTLSNIGIVIFFGEFARRTGGTDRRYATTARRSSSAMPLKVGYGCTGMSRSPLGRRPDRMAVMIWSSVHLPMHVSGSGVILVAYTVPKGPSYFRPPAFSAVAALSGSVWHPQPAATPKTYLPRAISSFDGGAVCAPAGTAPARAARTTTPRHTRPAESR